VRGGFSAGVLSIPWPFAGLEAKADAIGIFGLFPEAFELGTDEIIRFKARRRVSPVLGWGVQIVHRSVDLPEELIFWCLSPPTILIREIEATGFRPTGDGLPVPDWTTFRSGKLASTLTLLLVVGLGLVYLLLNVRADLWKEALLSGVWVLFALFTLVRMSPTFRRRILGSARELGYEWGFVRLTQILSGVAAVLITYLISAW